MNQINKKILIKNIQIKHIISLTIIYLLIFLFLSCEIANIEIYTITFNANGAAGSPPAPITVDEANYKSHWNRIMLPGKGNLNHNNKQFYGWNTSPDGSGSYYSAGFYIQVFSDIVLYAQWEQFLAPSNLRLNGINSLIWDAPEGYENLSNFGNDGNTRLGYLLFRRPVESTGNFYFYGYYKTNSISFSVHDNDWGTYEYFVALGTITFSYYNGLSDGIFIINYENNYSIKVGPHSNVITARKVSTSEVLPSPAKITFNVINAYSAKLSWDSVWPTSVYRVFSSSDGNNWSIYKDFVYSTELNITQDPGSKVFYRVSAINGTLLIVGTPSDIVIVTTPGGRPDVITGLSVNVLSSTSIELNWNSSVRATAYEIYYRNNSYSSLTLLDTVVSTKYIHTGLSSNTNYTYEVNAINNETNIIYKSNSEYIGGWNDGYTTYYTLPSVSCFLPLMSEFSEPIILTLTNKTSSLFNRILYNSNEYILPYNLNRNTSIQIPVSFGAHSISIFNNEDKYMIISLTIENNTSSYLITENDLQLLNKTTITPSFNITMKNNYAFAISKTYIRELSNINWQSLLLNNFILTNNSILLGNFINNTYELCAESLEYYRVNSGTNDKGISVSGGILEGYRPVWYLLPSFILNDDVTITIPATGWSRIAP